MNMEKVKGSGIAHLQAGLATATVGTTGAATDAGALPFGSERCSATAISA